MSVGKHAHPLKIARELDDCGSRLDAQAAAAIRDLHTQRDDLLAALKSAHWMLTRDYIDDAKMAVVEKCDAAITKSESAKAQLNEWKGGTA